MNEKIFDIAEALFPVIVTGLITFFISRYSFNKNHPLDKLEIAYNRVYYPLFRLTNDKSKSPKEILNLCDKYLTKYDKYVNRSTLRAYTVAQQDGRYITYKKFKDNIFNQSSFLRHRLGYLEPSDFSMLRYSSPKDKRDFRIVLYFLGIYTPIIVMNRFDVKEINFLNHILVYIFFGSLIFFIVEYAFYGIRLIYSLVLKLVTKRHKT